jgi:hypothetical protein
VGEEVCYWDARDDLREFAGRREGILRLLSHASRISPALERGDVTDQQAVADPLRLIPNSTVQSECS